MEPRKSQLRGVPNYGGPPNRSVSETRKGGANIMLTETRWQHEGGSTSISISETLL